MNQTNELRRFVWQEKRDGWIDATYRVHAWHRPPWWRRLLRRVGLR